MSDFIKIIATNRKARYLYHIIDKFEAGLVLKGSEVKSLRQGKVSFVDAFAKVEDGEVWLYNLHISPYDKGGYVNHDPLRKRKLLFNSREIRKISSRTQEKGLTFVPLKIYFRKSYIKMEMGLARGKNVYDKRDTIAERDAKRSMEREVRGKE